MDVAASSNLQDKPNETSQALVLIVTRAHAAVQKRDVEHQPLVVIHHGNHIKLTQPYGKHDQRPYHLDRNDTQDRFVGQQAGQHEDEFEQDGKAADPSRVWERRSCPDEGSMVADLGGRGND